MAVVHLVLVVDVCDRLLRRLVLVRHQMLRKNILEVSVDNVLNTAVTAVPVLR
jgi:hypothetical protein